MFENLANSFMLAAKAMFSPEVRTPGKGLTGNALKKLDFRAGGRVFEVIEQNSEKFSNGATLARKGHRIAQVKDIEGGNLIGYVDIDEGAFFSYDATPVVADIADIEKAMAAAGQKVDTGNVEVLASRGSAPPARQATQAQQNRMTQVPAKIPSQPASESYDELLAG